MPYLAVTLPHQLGASDNADLIRDIPYSAAYETAKRAALPFPSTFYAEVR